MRAASRNIRAQAWLGVGRFTSSTRVLVRMPYADSAEATGAPPKLSAGKAAADSQTALADSPRAMRTSLDMTVPACTIMRHGQASNHRISATGSKALALDNTKQPFATMPSLRKSCRT